MTSDWFLFTSFQGEEYSRRASVEVALSLSIFCISEEAMIKEWETVVEQGGWGGVGGVRLIHFSHS